MTLWRLAALVGIAVGVLAANVAISVLYMVVYGYVIDPGHENEYYQEHIKVAAPYCSIAAGIPLMFLVGWWVGGFWGGGSAVQSAVVVWLAYAAIDLAVVAASGVTACVGVLVALSLLTKLLAVYCGALVASRRV